MRTKKHYEDMLNRNPNASVGFTLAAQAVYAARHGHYPGPNESDGTDVDEFREIALTLKRKYGENLTPDAVQHEMDQAKSTDKRLTITYPYQIWAKLRDLQTRGKIRSIQHATLVAVQVMLAKIEREEGKGHEN